MTMILAGVGEGLIKILQAADNREPWVYAVAGFFLAYALVVGFFLCRQWYKHLKRADSGVKRFQLLKSQAAALLSLAFVVFVLFELTRRLIG